MKSIYLVILIVFSITCFAQQNSSPTSAPDLIVIKTKMDYIIREDAPRPHQFPQQDDGLSQVLSRPNPEWQAKVDLEVQNNGNENIKSFEWEYSLKEIDGSVKPVRSYRIQTKKTIKPGETIKVSGWIKDARLEEIRKPLKEGLLKEQAEIKRITYSDGKVWMPLKRESARQK